MPIAEDHLSDDEEVQQILKEVNKDIGYENIVVVDNLPVVTSDKYEKLVNVVKKVFSEKVFGVPGKIKDDGLYMPRSADNSTKGYAFLEFSNPEEAKLAVSQADNYRLDKNHVFRVNLFTDFKKYAEVSDDYQVPEPKKYEPRDNLRVWLMDSRGRDQFAVRYGEECEIYWNDAAQKLELEKERKNWTESYVAWSPMGTYLATFHRQGIVLWGGPKWDKLMRFNHPSVKLIDFSPKENYLVTWNNQENDNVKDPQAIIIWDIRSGKKLRGFSGMKEGSSSSVWPVFKWSSDDKYFARLTEEGLAVYEASTMLLLGKKAVKAEEVRDFAWSPSTSDHIIASWQPEIENTPARVSLIKIPERTEIRQKNLFNVSDIKLYWQSEGDFLCVKVDRFLKNKKLTNTNFEFFRMRDKDIPVETLELKAAIVAFAWEPKGIRFAVIHGEGGRPDVSFYTMETIRGGKLRLLKTLEKKPCNLPVWSPQGSHIVLAGLKNLNGILEFFNVDTMDTMGQDEHFMATDVEWDPTGRYLATSVSYWRHQMENGFMIWSFQGKVLHRISKERFYQLLWRPRPPSLLPPEKIEAIRKNLHEYSRTYLREDEEVRKTQVTDELKQKQRLRDDFEQYMRQKVLEYQNEKEARRQARGGIQSDDERDYEYKEEWVEEIVDKTEVIVY